MRTGESIAVQAVWGGLGSAWGKGARLPLPTVCRDQKTSALMLKCKTQNYVTAGLRGDY